MLKIKPVKLELRGDQLYIDNGWDFVPLSHSRRVDLIRKLEGFVWELKRFQDQRKSDFMMELFSPDVDDKKIQDSIKKLEDTLRLIEKFPYKKK